MLEKLKESTHKAKTRGQDLVDDAKEVVEGAVGDAKDRLHRTRREARQRVDEGRVGLYKLGTETLEKAQQVLEHTPDPLDPVVDPLRKVIDQGLSRAADPGIEGYDQLNARKAADSVRDLDPVALERVERHERAHKNRKTVLGAIDKRRERLARR